MLLLLLSHPPPPRSPAALPAPPHMQTPQSVQEKLALDKAYYGKLLARDRGAGPIGTLGGMDSDYAAGGYGP